ncbi:MAG: cysteine--tRNA ligase [Deltaproteobacteria bacterium]|nr:cysteine--tRNA ligase [Deltaproteobacteria bacterium]
MALRVYNTLTKKKEEFIPIEEGKVGIYVCGITAYDVCHVGHARSAIVFDVIYKYLKFKGYDVTYVKNFTDVDDKIIEKAITEKADISEISERYIVEHNADMDKLGIARPTITPRATENIKGMVRLVDTLLGKGLAYVSEGGDVYFSVKSFPGYAKLSGKNMDDMLAGARVDVDKNKKNSLDFVLWKSSKKGEPWWDSPWGRGRPGWHLECSVMSQRYLGETFDIHGGGEDLIFPHHENEIAQSEGATGKPFARYWIHNGFIRVDNEKMSKSLGNIFTIKDILEQFHPEVLRLFILQSHYKSYIDFSHQLLADARQGMGRFYGTLKKIKDALDCGIDYSHVYGNNLSGMDEEVFGRIRELPEKFSEAMDDDFNTAKAIGSIFDGVRIINGYMGDKSFEATPASLFVLEMAKKNIMECGKTLGLFLEDPDVYFDNDRKREAGKLGMDIDEIEGMIRERKEARDERNWVRADEIRTKLASRGVILKDGPSQTTWKIK